MTFLDKNCSRSRRPVGIGFNRIESDNVYYIAASLETSEQNVLNALLLNSRAKVAHLAVHDPAGLSDFVIIELSKIPEAVRINLGMNEITGAE